MDIQLNKDLLTHPKEVAINLFFGLTFLLDIYKRKIDVLKSSGSLSPIEENQLYIIKDIHADLTTIMDSVKDFV